MFPEPVTPAHAPKPPYFVCCPGGGGNQVLGRQSGAVFAEAAVAAVDGGGRDRGILVGQFAGVHVRRVGHEAVSLAYCVMTSTSCGP